MIRRRDNRTNSISTPVFCISHVVYELDLESSRVKAREYPVSNILNFEIRSREQERGESAKTRSTLFFLSFRVRYSVFV